MAKPGETVEWDLDWEDLPAASPPPVPADVASVAPSVAPPSPPPVVLGLPLAQVAPSTVAPVSAPPPLSVVSGPSPALVPPPAPRFLVRGQRVRLAEWSPAPEELEVAFSLPSAPGLTLDLCCFGLDAAGRLSDDRYFIFYNQKTSPEGALSVEGGTFRADLARLPASVRRLAYTVTVDGPGSVRALGECSCDLRRMGGEPLARFPFVGRELDEVAALIVAEVYRRDDADWRIGAVAQGFAGGLPALLRHFGGEEH